MQDFCSATGARTRELHVVTTGDKIVDRALSEIGGKGLFIKEIEEAILEGRADCAVHSLKDVPPELAGGLELGCIPKRADPRDAIRTRSGCSFSELPRGAKVGTSSLRRIAQLKQHRPDLEFVPIRGNVDTRLRKCDEGEVDAVVLATAGLQRLGLESKITEILTPELCLPAVGQGALAIEHRSGDDTIRQLLSRVNDPETALIVAAERGVMRAVEGNCQIPVGAYAIREAERIFLRGMLADADGDNLRYAEARAPWPTSEEEATQFGWDLGQQLRRP